MQSKSSKPFSYESFPSAGVVAYFSMEIAINPAMPTYSGGLGMLARQGALALELWLGVPAPLEVMLAAIRPPDART